MPHTRWFPPAQAGIVVAHAALRSAIVAVNVNGRIRLRRHLPRPSAGCSGDDRPRHLSAVRLRLRERYLQSVADEALETGEVELAKLPEPVRKAFMCYLFLATLQELIIQRLDESIIGS